MSIKEFSFIDHRTGWEVKNIQFRSSLNLLVGVSGAGKTQLLHLLETVCRAGHGALVDLIDCEWRVQFDVRGTTYTWTARTDAEPEYGPIEDNGTEYDLDGAICVYVEEEVRSDTLHIVRRDGQITLDGEPVPELKDTESVVSILRNVEGVAPLTGTVSMVRAGYTHTLKRRMKTKQLQAVSRRFSDVATLRSEPRLILLAKAYILQERFPDNFRRLVTLPYQEIFPTVTEVKIAPEWEFLPEWERARTTPNEVFEAAIREEGVERWIRSEDLSAGMERTLIHILELALLPPGSVLLLDEYENSMGVNCLPAVTEHLLDRAGELQFILTSHHPYVISNVAREHWMVVRRRGGVVEVIPATSIPSLDTRSSQDAFIQLINAEEYLGGGT